MSVKNIILRLLGKDPELLAGQEELQRNLVRMDAIELQYDAIISSTREVSRVAQEKENELRKTADTMRPPHETVRRLEGFDDDAAIRESGPGF